MYSCGNVAVTKHDATSIRSTVARHVTCWALQFWTALFSVSQSSLYCCTYGNSYCNIPHCNNSTARPKPQERVHVQGQLEEARRHAEESDKKRRESDVALIKSERQMLKVKEERDKNRRISDGKSHTVSSLNP